MLQAASSWVPPFLTLLLLPIQHPFTQKAKVHFYEVHLLPIPNVTPGRKPSPRSSGQGGTSRSVLRCACVPQEAPKATTGRSSQARARSPLLKEENAR